MQVVTNHGLVSRMNAYFGFKSSILDFAANSRLVKLKNQSLEALARSAKQIEAGLMQGIPKSLIWWILLPNSAAHLLCIRSSQLRIAQGQLH